MVITSNKSCLSFCSQKTDVKRFVLNDVSHWLLIQLIQPVLRGHKKYLQRKRIIKTFFVQLKIVNCSKLFDPLVSNNNVKQPSKCQKHNEIHVLQRT